MTTLDESSKVAQDIGGFFFFNVHCSHSVPIENEVIQISNKNYFLYLSSKKYQILSQVLYFPNIKNNPLNVSGFFLYPLIVIKFSFPLYYYIITIINIRCSPYVLNICINFFKYYLVSVIAA